MSGDIMEDIRKMYARIAYDVYMFRVRLGMDPVLMRMQEEIIKGLTAMGLMEPINAFYNIVVRPIDNLLQDIFRQLGALK